MKTTARGEALFRRVRFPVLTPLASTRDDPSLISNLSLNLAILIRDNAERTHFARVKIPGTLPQIGRSQSAQAEPEADASPIDILRRLDEVIVAI